MFQLKWLYLEQKDYKTTEITLLHALTHCMRKYLHICKELRWFAMDFLYS